MRPKHLTLNQIYDIEADNPPLARSARPPLERMLRIHQTVQSGLYPSAVSLAGMLQVSAKVIGRDLRFMRERLQLPLKFDVHRRGYYYEYDVSAFPQQLQISESELFSLLLAKKALTQYRGTIFERPLVSAFQKISAALPDTLSQNLSNWKESISFRTRAEPILNLQIFDALARATTQRQQIQLTYRKPGSQDTELRLVDPYHLANINGEWYLFAYCHRHKDIRTFAPARIAKVEMTGRTFIRPEQFSLERTLRDSFGVEPGHGKFDVVIRFNKEVSDLVREKKWHESQQLKELKDGRVELRLKLSSLGEIERWILGWAGDAQVVAPDELAAGVASAARKILRAATLKTDHPRRNRRA